MIRYIAPTLFPVKFHAAVVDFWMIGRSAASDESATGTSYPLESAFPIQHLFRGDLSIHFVMSLPTDQTGYDA